MHSYIIAHALKKYVKIVIFSKISPPSAHSSLSWAELVVFSISPAIKGGGGRGLNRLDLTVGRFFFLSFGKMSSGWETVEIN